MQQSTTGRIQTRVVLDFNDAAQSFTLKSHSYFSEFIIFDTGTRSPAHIPLIPMTNKLFYRRTTLEFIKNRKPVPGKDKLPATKVFTRGPPDTAL